MAKRNLNGEGSIYQRKDKRWVAAIQDGFRDDGKPNIVYFTSVDKRIVTERLRDFKAKKQLGLDSQAKKQKSISFGVYISKWMTSVKSIELKPTSYDRLEATVNNNVIPLIGSISITNLSADDIQVLVINKLFEDGLSYSTIKKAYDAINACCKYALINRVINHNPCQTVSLPSKHKFEMSEIRFLTDDEITKFKEKALQFYKNGKPIYPLANGYIFIMNTGIRLGEALALKWNDIDFDNKVLKVTKNVVMAVDRESNSKKRVPIEQDSTKTDSGYRQIPLNKTALSALQELKKIRYFGEDSYVMSTAYNEQNKVRNFCRTFETIIEKAGIDPCGIHTLRHTFASKLFRAGIDVKTVSELLGHSSTQVTYNTYIHLIQEQKTTAVNLIDEV